MEWREGTGPLPCPLHRQREEESGHNNKNTLHEYIIIIVMYIVIMQDIPVRLGGARGVKVCNGRKKGVLLAYTLHEHT